MGTATKYISPADLLPIEHDFYANLNPQVLVGAERYTGDVAVLWARVQSLWRTLSWHEISRLFLNILQTCGDHSP